MSETSGLKFKTAYDEAKANIASSLDAVKITYENINRDLADEIKGLDKEKKDLTASLTKAKKDIEGLQNNIKTLETSLGASKDLVASTQQTLEAEKASSKEAAVNAAKAAKEFETYKQQVAAAEKASDTVVANLKQEMAVQKSTLEQTQAALAEEKSKAKDAAHANATASTEMQRKIDTTRDALEAQKKACADLENKLNSTKAQLAANVKEFEASRQDLNGKITALTTEITASKAATADWQREADKAKGEAEKSRAAAESANQDKHAAQEARVLAEKDSKTALEAKGKAEAEKAEKERDAKEAIAATTKAMQEADKANKELESTKEKFATLTTRFNELSETSKVTSANDAGMIKSLQATLVEKDAAITSLKEQFADMRRSLSDKLSEETAGHEGTKSSLERLKQESYNLYTAYTGCMQQLEEYKVALERESQESARLHQAMATQKQEAARDAFRTNKSMLLPPSSLAGLASGGGSGNGGMDFGNFGSFAPGASANITDLNPDGSSPYSAGKTAGGASGENSFAVD